MAILGEGWALPRGLGLLLSGLLLLGVLLSAGHLGRPLRAPLAARGMGRSPLSNEIGALTLALAGGILGLLLPEASVGGAMAGALAAGGSFLFLLALGRVYALPGRPDWQGMVVLQPLLLGTALGLLVVLGVHHLPDHSFEPSGRAPLLAFLGADLILAAALARKRIIRRLSGEVVHPWARGWRKPLLGIRLAATGGAMTAVLPFSLYGWALLLLSLALVLDRIAFYALSVRETTESELGRMEALLGLLEEPRGP
jgi:DMSO reductase anchor subunit